MEALQQRHAEVLGVGVRVRRALVVGGLGLVVGGLGSDEAADLRCTVGAQHSVGLDHLHIWKSKGRVERVKKWTRVCCTFVSIQRAKAALKYNLLEYF